MRVDFSSPAVRTASSTRSTPIASVSPVYSARSNDTWCMSAAALLIRRSGLDVTHGAKIVDLVGADLREIGRAMPLGKRAP